MVYERRNLGCQVNGKEAFGQLDESLPILTSSQVAVVSQKNNFFYWQLRNIKCRFRRLTVNNNNNDDNNGIRVYI